MQKGWFSAENHSLFLLIFKPFFEIEYPNTYWKRLNIFSDFSHKKGEV